MRKIISLFIIVHLLLSNSYAHSNYPSVKGYLEGVLNDGYAIFKNSKLTIDQKKKRSADIVRDNMYFSWMAKASLGRHKKKLSQEKITEFTKAYKEFIIVSYSELSKQYNGQQAKINTIRRIDNDKFMARVEIKASNTPPYKVDYLVLKLGEDNFKTGDIITEGVSILNSQQAEFNSIITNNGIDALIKELKTKAAKN